MDTLDDLERKFFQEDYAPGLSTGQVVERTNLSLNPSLETNINTFGYNAGTGGTATPTRELSGGVFGSCFYRVTWTVSNTGGTPVIYGAGTPSDNPTIKPNTTYTASLYVRCSSAVTIRLALDSYEGTTWRTTTAGSNVNLVANTWTRISITLTTAANINRLIPMAMALAGQIMAIGTTLDVDGVLLEESSSVGTYFDGDTADFNNGNYVWSGTPHASISKLLVPEPLLSDGSVDVNSRNQNFLEHSYWAKRSGLTPKEQYSLNDHMFSALRAEGFTGTNGDMLFQKFSGNEYEYYKTQLGL